MIQSMSRLTRIGPYVLVLGLVIVVIVVVWYCWPCWFHSDTTVLLVRHAEKSTTPPEDPLLSPEGEARAAELVHVAGAVDIAAIYVTTTNRTRRTAQDLADDRGLIPVELAPTDTEGVVDQIRSDHAGETVLVVGHSNTLPDIIEGLGGEPMDDIAESDFDNLFVVSVGCHRRVKVTHLRYGVATPP